MKLAVCQLCLNIAAGCLLSSFCLPSQERWRWSPNLISPRQTSSSSHGVFKILRRNSPLRVKIWTFLALGDSDPSSVPEKCSRPPPWLAGCSRGRVGWTNHSCGRQCHNSNRYFRSNFVIMLIFARQYSALQLCLLSCNVSSSCRPARPSRCCAMSTF